MKSIFNAVGILYRVAGSKTQRMSASDQPPHKLCVKPAATDQRWTWIAPAMLLMARHRHKATMHRGPLIG
jgi:hypothetical protein